MADSDKLIPFIRKWEGGFSDHPADRGGATNKGITLATYAAYRRRKGIARTTADDLRRLTEAEWSEIFVQEYWNRFRADGIRSQSVADLSVDWLWCSGGAAIRSVQWLAGVPADGIVGVRTLAALNDRDPQLLFELIRLARLDFLEGICRRNPSQRVFLTGWRNRVNDLKYEPDESAG